MGYPWKGIGLSAVATAAFLSWQLPSWTRGGFAGTLVILWLLQTVAYGVYRVLIWPKYLSPLIGLPEPSDNHWLLGQWPRISAEPSGLPMQDWFVDAPFSFSLPAKTSLQCHKGTKRAAGMRAGSSEQQADQRAG